MALSETEIFEKVQSVLEDALGVDADEVKGESRLGPDLGAESIDYLDISFRLEKAFGIKISEGEMFDQSVLTNAAFVDGNKITAAGLAELKAKMPHADFTAFEQNPEIKSMANLFTVTMVCKFVKAKLPA